jgi:polysaccharide biosynthesis/export protein
MWTPTWFWLIRRWFSLIIFFLLPTAVIPSEAIAQEPTATPSANVSGSTPIKLNDTNGAVSEQSDNSANSGNSVVRLGPGDLLAITVYGVPELTTKARVSNSGDLYLPLIDYVHVGDLSLEETQTLIEKRLSEGAYVKNPHVTVFIDEYSSQAVTVLGEVTKPGVYPILGDRRLFDVISAAGGFTDKAGKIVTITHRNHADQPRIVRLSQHLEQGTDDNIGIAPGDTIVISKAGVVYVVGDVNRPSGFVMESDSVTILQAIAMAGGTNKTAKLNGARILRRTSQGTQEQPILLKKILQAKTPDLPMQAGDILFVPSSAAKTLIYRSTEAVVQAATGLAIVAYRP